MSRERACLPKFLCAQHDLILWRLKTAHILNALSLRVVNFHVLVDYSKDLLIQNLMLANTIHKCL